MWTALLTEGPTAPGLEAAGSPAALIITAVCGGLAALITAVSLLLRARRDDAPEPTGGRPMGERVAVVEQELGDLREEFEELRDLLTVRRPARTVPAPRRSMTP